MMSIPILVTGGAGFIGSFVCKSLKEAGYLPITFDNLSTGKKEAVRYGPLVTGDLLNKSDILSVCKKARPFAVIHLAASSVMADSFSNPILYYENNLVGTLNLLESMRVTGVKQLIYASSASVYGYPQTVRLDESHPTHPLSPYGRAKLLTEEIIKDCEKAYGMRSMIFRFFNVAGADANEMLGEEHTPETHLIPLLVQTLLGLRTGITIFGNTFPTPDGTAIRDYVHVKDIAQGHIQGLDYLAKGGKSTILNLGSGIGTSVQELLNALSVLTGYNRSILYKEAREGDPPFLIANSTKARALLHWQPTNSEREIILQSVLDYTTNKLGISGESLWINSAKN